MTNKSIIRSHDELSDEDLRHMTGGALIATEWIFVATILVLGMVTGMVQVRGQNGSAPAPTNNSGQTASR
jgi:hypothetical protein